MADLFAVAGATIHIGPAMPVPDDNTLDSADLTSVVWVEIKDWMQCGTFGDTRALITTQLIDRDRDVKQAGTANAGNFPCVWAINPTDPGQIALRAAANTKLNYPFKIEWDDAPAGGTNSTDEFLAIVMGTPQAGGGPNTVRALNANIEINTNILTTPATGP